MRYTIGLGHIEVLEHLYDASPSKYPQDGHPLLDSKGMDSLGLAVHDSSDVLPVLSLIYHLWINEAKPLTLMQTHIA